jgi:Domain of unknown function (DUF4188)
MDEPFVVFLIGMRINRLLAFNKWIPTIRAMPPMLKELYQHPEKGFLGGEFSPTGEDRRCCSTGGRTRSWSGLPAPTPPCLAPLQPARRHRRERRHLARNLPNRSRPLRGDLQEHANFRLGQNHRARASQGPPGDRPTSLEAGRERACRPFARVGGKFRI